MKLCAKIHPETVVAVCEDLFPSAWLFTRPVNLCARNNVISKERNIRSEEKKRDLNALCQEK